MNKLFRENKAPDITNRKNASVKKRFKMWSKHKRQLFQTENTCKKAADEALRVSPRQEIQPY